LHRLVFIQYLLNGNIEACLTYAKQQFPSFSKNHLHDIQRLMCAMLFSFRLSTSPYEDLIESHSRLDVLKLFTRNFCCLLGLPPSSPLFVSIMVGTTSLPTIIKMSSILKGNMALEWQSRGELPVEIPLLDSQRYHSVFTCPVSKEQSTNENPSMLLLCGHVIAKEALNRLGKGNMNAKFKVSNTLINKSALIALKIARLVNAKEYSFKYNKFYWCPCLNYLIHSSKIHSKAGYKSFVQHGTF
jgi:hypothetical protein